MRLGPHPQCIVKVQISNSALYGLHHALSAKLGIVIAAL
jgi:hypothetical protein